MDCYGGFPDFCEFKRAFASNLLLVPRQSTKRLDSEALKLVVLWDLSGTNVRFLGLIYALVSLPWSKNDHQDKIGQFL